MGKTKYKEEMVINKMVHTGWTVEVMGQGLERIKIKTKEEKMYIVLVNARGLVVKRMTHTDVVTGSLLLGLRGGKLVGSYRKEEEQAQEGVSAGWVSTAFCI